MKLLVALFVMAACIASGAEFFIAPSGSDGATGTREKPFASLERARDAARDAHRSSPAETTTVWLRAGDYHTTKAFDLTSADSNTVYRSVEGEAVRLIGARTLKAADFHGIRNPATLARIAPKLRGKIVEFDLQAAGIVHGKAYPDVFNDQGGIVSLYFGGARMPIAQFPNNDFTMMKRVLDTGGGLQDRNWSTPTNTKPAGTGIFEYREDAYEHFERWQEQLDRGVWLKGYWRIPWQNEAVRLQSIDTVKHTATLATPVPGGIGNKYTRPDGNGKEQYWLLNLLEEVDMPGEWCVDFRDRKLYFYPPGPIEQSEVLLADLGEPIIRLIGASNVVLRGLIIEGGLDHGIQVKGGESNLIAGTTVRNVNRYGVVLEGGSKNGVVSSDLYSLGGGGVWLSGGDEKSNPRVAAGHQVVNNHIHHFAEIERVYAPGVNVGFTGGGGGGHHVAVGMYVANNLIHDTPHAGVLFGSWDSVFEYNEVFRFCTVSNDMGAFYSYDLFDRMGNITFRYNLMHSSDEGDGIYFDHDHRDMKIYGNIAYLKSTGNRGYGYLYKIGSQAKNPTSISCYNNVAIACNRPYEFVSALPEAASIKNNVSVKSKQPAHYSVVREGKAVVVPEGYASGKMISYEDNPGFVDIERMDFHVKPGAQLLRDMPDFQPIPVDRIGLYLDEYRRKLPTNEEIDRFNLRTKRTNLGYDILDRK